MIDKVLTSALAAMERIPDGASIAVGGFGITGVAFDLLDALCELGRRDLHIISNNPGVDERGIGRLAREGRIGRFTGSFPANPDFQKRFMRGEVEVELVPQGTLAERLRAGGFGIPAFYTPTSVGTVLAHGGYPSRRDADGRPVEFLGPKDVRVFDGKPAVLEYAIRPDFAIVKAHRGDRLGNLAFRRSARNFNPVAAGAGGVTFAEVRYLVDVGDLDPDDVHLPGVLVDHVVLSTEGPVDAHVR